MGKRAFIDEKKFNCVKIMLKAKTPYKEICDYLGVSPATIGRITGAENFQEYKQILSAQKTQKKKTEQMEMQLKPEQPAPQVVEHKQTVVVQATHYMMEEMKKTNELLTLLNAKIAFIVEELAGCKASGGDEK